MRVLLLSVVCLIAFLPGCATFDASGGFELPFVSQPAEFELPGDLANRNEAIDGAVVFAVLVDLNGVVVDHLLVGSTNPRLEPIAWKALNASEFSPAKIFGRPIEGHVAVSFLFNTEEPRIACFDVESLVVRNAAGGRLQMRVFRADELDEMPRVVQEVAPRSAGTRASVKLEFFIDEEGRVRMPTLVEGQPSAASASALEALAQWRFNPPRHAGKPVVALVRQLFHF